MSGTQKKLSFGKREIILLGTAHVSKESVEEVTALVKETMPDCVAVELDAKRYKTITEPENYRKLDIISVLKKKEGFLLLANLVLSAFQRRMGQSVGVKPGDEMLAALKIAKELNIPHALVDRSIEITLRRAWAKNSLWGKCKLLASLIASAFGNEDISEEEIEALKKSNEMDSMMNDLSDYLPTVKEVLINERDKYLAASIWKASGNKILAVLGAGHLPGVQMYLEKIASGEESTDTSLIDSVPKKSAFSKIIPYIIPAFILALIIVGFIVGGKNIGTKMIGNWVLWNGVLAAIGALLAAAHPFAIILSFIAAPLTSLTPVVGVGIVSGIVQALSCKAKVSDMEELQQDATSIKGWYKNRILRVLLVFLFSSLGSSIGTFVAGAGIIKSIGDVINKIMETSKNLSF
ncbi:MAG: TraB/GumN family protein [Treponema sp.]|nr:TraB/GumN family protein [Treponema sp.]